MTVSIWQQAHRRREMAYDVVVIGGGIVGCSTAYWLHRKRPAWRIAILEARTLGSGASGRNAGFILQGTHADYLSDVKQYGKETARRLWHFTRANRDLLESELRGSAFGWRSNGSLTVAGDAEEDRRLRESVSHLRSAGAPVVYLEPEETNERLQATGFQGGLLVTTGAVVNPLKLVHHIASESDADVRDQHPVERVHWSEDGAVVDTPELRFGAQKVVLAVGSSLPDLAPGLANVVRPMRGQMLATAPAEEVRVPMPVYSHRGEFYLRQLEGGSVVVGGGREQHREAEETDEDATTPAVQASIERYLHRHFPWTKSLSVRRRWSGTMGFSPDGRPVVGRLPDQPNGVYATAFTGHGMAYGFRMGRLLANLVEDQEWPKELDLFHASRFDERGSASASSATLGGT